MSEDNLDVKEGEVKKESGEIDKFASKDELAAIVKSLDEQSRKNEHIFNLITSPEFLSRSNPPAPPKQEEKNLSQEELDEMKPSQLLSVTLDRVAKMLEQNNAKIEESLHNVSATIKQVTDIDADREAERQIERVKSDYGEDEFNKHRPAMVKIVAATPGITAERAFLIARGEANPIKKSVIPKAPRYEKPGQEADFTDTKLSPDAAAEKAYVKNFGADENPI